MTAMSWPSSKQCVFETGREMVALVTKLDVKSVMCM